MAATRTVSPPLLIRLGWHSPFVRLCRASFLRPFPPSSLLPSSAFNFSRSMHPTGLARSPSALLSRLCYGGNPDSVPAPTYTTGVAQPAVRLRRASLLRPFPHSSLHPSSAFNFRNSCTLPGSRRACQHRFPGSAKAATWTVSPPLLIRLGWHSPSVRLCRASLLRPFTPPRSFPPPHLISGMHAPYRAREEPVSTAFPALPRRQPGQCPRPLLIRLGWSWFPLVSFSPPPRLLRNDNSSGSRASILVPLRGGGVDPSPLPSFHPSLPSLGGAPASLPPVLPLSPA